MERGIAEVERWMLESFNKFVGMIFDPKNENYELNSVGVLPVGEVSFIVDILR